jgi:mono/diheme cytochrome c family protein
MRTALRASAVLWLAIATVQVLAADDVVPTAGAIIFERHCAACHAPGTGNPGTQRLTELYGQAQAALLDRERETLSVDLVRYTVRHGRGLMPGFRASEISARELDTLAQYLTAGSAPRIKD